MSKSIGAYKAIFFDAGDTLITIPAAHEIMQAHLLKQGFPADLHSLPILLDESIYHYYHNKKDYSVDAVTPESDRRFWMLIYRFIMDRLDAQAHWTEDQIHRCCHEMYDLFVSPEYYALFDDVKPCLDRLAEMGLRLGLISNFAPTLRAICDKFGIAGYFDPFIVSTEVGLEKPNPAIFRLALERSGLAPHEVLYIGDHAINDVWAPEQEGIDTLRIIRYEGIEGEGIRTLTDLFELEGKE